MTAHDLGPAWSATEGGARKSDQLDSKIASKNTKSAITTQAFNWRAHLAVHPAAEAFPLLSEKELKELAGDIKRNGLQTSIVIWSPEANAKCQLLDGRNRLDALVLIGQLAVDEQARLCIKKAHGTLEPIDQQHIVGGDPEKLAYSLNHHRRHLTPEQKRELIARQLKKTPEASDRQIGKQIKADNKTVAAVRGDLERREEIPHVEVRADTKGRKQPAKKKTPRKPSTPKPEREAKQKKKIERRELEAAHAHIDELEAAREHDKDIAEKLRMAEFKIIGLESEIGDLKRENAELRQALENAKAKETAS
jgi:hypothetical protein